MNYLAHFFLSHQNDGQILGAFLGDFVKGPLTNSKNQQLLRQTQFPNNLEKGIRLHRHIDANFDALPIFDKFKNQCPRGLRRYSGIFIDLYCDYLLCEQWNSFTPKPIEEFESLVVKTLKKYKHVIPARSHRLIDAFDEHHLLQRYKNRHMVESVLERIGQRLKLEEFDKTLAPLWELTNSIDLQFDQLMEDMQKVVQRFLACEDQLSLSITL